MKKKIYIVAKRRHSVSGQRSKGTEREVIGKNSKTQPYEQL